MLFPRREDRPDHVPVDPTYDYDMFSIDAGDGDFAGVLSFIAIFLEEWLARIPDCSVAASAVLEVRVGATAMIPSLPLVWPVV